MKQIFQNKLLIILILAAALRILFLNRVPASLNWDEVSMGYTAFSVSETGRDEWGTKLPLFFRSYGEWKSAVYIYLLVPFIKLLGLNAWAIRLPAAIFGILAVYLTYLIGRRIYNERVGVAAAFLLAVSPWHLMLSRPGFEAGVALTLVLAGIYFFLQFISAIGHRQYKFLVFSALFFGLAPHTYNSAKLVVPILVLYLIWQSKLYQKVKALALYLVLLTLFASPILLSLFSGISQARFSQVSVVTDQQSLTAFYDLRHSLPFPDQVKKLIINKATFTAYKTTDNWLAYFSPPFLVTRGGNHTQHSLPYHGVLYFTEFILVIAGAALLRRHGSRFKYLPLWLIGLGFIPAALTRDSGHVLRSILTLPGWQLLAALGIVHLQQIKTPYLKIVNWILVIEVLSFMLMYFTWYPLTYARDWQFGHQEVAAYLREHATEYDRIVMTKWFGEPQLFLVFYNRWDPQMYQQDNFQNISYEKEGRLWLDQLPEYSVGKYTFKYLDWDTETQSSGTLYIGKFDDFPSDAQIVKTVIYPDGNTAFVLVAGNR